jgi:hypothetical protein
MTPKGPEGQTALLNKLNETPQPEEPLINPQDLAAQMTQRQQDLAYLYGEAYRPQQEALAKMIADQRARTEAEAGTRRDESRGLAALTAAGKLLQPGRQGLGALGEAFSSVVPIAAAAKKDERDIQNKLDAADLEQKRLDLSMRRGDVENAQKASIAMQGQIQDAAKIVYDQAYRQKELELRGSILDEEKRKNAAREYAELRQIDFTHTFQTGMLGVHRAANATAAAQVALAGRRLGLEEALNPLRADYLRAQADDLRARAPAAAMRFRNEGFKQFDKLLAGVAGKREIERLFPGMTLAQARDAYAARYVDRQLLSEGTGIGTPPTQLDSLPEGATVRP